MADEPRRSGRATKGQHTKNFDIDAPQGKRKGKAQAKAAKQTPTEPTPPATEDDDEIIRCVCGEYEEEEDVERDMICCDQCSAWQHNDCMGLNFAKGEEPAEYYCEQCKPENHKELLEKMARGGKPWEEAAKIRAQQAAEKKPRRKKGGKRGRKPRASEPKSEMGEGRSASAAATPSKDTPVHPTHDDQRETPGGLTANEQSTSQKRKFAENDGGTSEPEPKPKLQRISTGPSDASPNAQRSPVHERKPSAVATTPSVQPHAASMSPAGGAQSPTDYMTVPRQHTAKALAKLFVGQVGDAQQQGTFTIPPGQKKEGIGENLGFAVEGAMYRHLCGGSGEPNDAYKQQLRTILFNVRKNSSLRDSLLVGSISPDSLSTMSTQDMASKELRQKDDEIKREAERQHIIIEETGPRIRRTHKGEEIVEETDPNVEGNESIFSTAPARRDTRASSQGHSAMSPRGASPPVTQGPEFFDFKGSHGSTQRPPPIDTHVSDNGDKRRTSSTNFDIQNVWSSVQSPGSGPRHDQVFGQAYPEQSIPAGNKVQADAEIDQLLKDDNDADSPPYSPEDFQADGAVWHGRVVMLPHTDFFASARHVGGADLSGRMPWSQLIPTKVVIDGRIGTQLANSYLCDLRYSHTVDVTVVAVPPPDSPNDAVQFNRLFDHLVQRDRYGVFSKHNNPEIKDLYFVPVEAGSHNRPEFIELLENNAIEDPTPERVLLVVFVVKSSTHPSETTPTSQRPTPRSISQPQSLFSTPTTQAGPGPAMGSNHGQTQPDSPSNDHGEQPYEPPPAQEPTGETAASQILGSYVTAPAIQEVLQHAPDANASQFKLVASILAENPAAANDYQTLMTAIAQVQNGPSVV